MIDVFGGSGFVAMATHHFGLCGSVLDAKFGPKYDVTQPVVLTRIRQNVSARSIDFTFTSTQFVLFQSYFRQCLYRKFVSYSTQSEHCFGWTSGQQICEPYCSQVCWAGGRYSVTGEKMVIQKKQCRTQRSILHVTTLVLTVYLPRLPWFSP